MWKPLLDALLQRLRRETTFVLRACEIQRGIDEALLQRIQSESGLGLPDDLCQLYREMNGIELDWSIWTDAGELPGAIVLLPLQTAIFGYAERIDRDAVEDAFKDSLWTTDSFADESIVELKRHRVLEAIAGEPAFVTFKPDPSGCALFHVYEEDIKSIKPALSQYLALLFRYLGAGQLRDHVTREDWQDAVASDPALQALERIC